MCICKMIRCNLAIYSYCFNVFDLAIFQLLSFV